MRILSTLVIISIAVSSFGQFSSTPCGAGSLTTACAANTVNLTSGFTNSGITDPTIENGGTGCSSVGSDQTAGTIGNSGGSQDYDGWFTTTANASGVVDVYAAIVTGDPVIALYSGPCGSPTLITCDDDGGTGLDAYINQTGLTPGGTYWVRIWDYAGGTGTYEVTTNEGAPPANDDCASATGLTLNAAGIAGTTYCATVEASDWNDCESNTENNVWYSFTTTVDGDITVNVTSVDCFGSGAGVDVTVFYGNCSSFSSYGCAPIAAGSSGSIPQFTGPAGTYYVMIDGDNSGGATSLCDFDVDVDFVGCTADAGTNTSPALINNCFGTDVTTVTATGTTNTYLGADPCIGWGYWVASDPLGAFAGMTNIGDLPTGNNPAGSGGDPNFAGVWTSLTFPLANGETPTLPSEGNGVTYYIAPITLSNCQTGEINSGCFDIGTPTQIYFNPEIVYTTVIDCDNAATPTTQVAIAIGGGLPSVDGSNFTLTNLGAGTLSSTTVADGGTVTVTGVPDGGTVSILITDGVGCTETITLASIDASAYCPFCGVDAGTVTETLTGSGSTSGITHIMCFGDQLDIIHNNDYALPPDLNFCGDSPLTGTVAGSCNPGIVYGIFTDLATTANPFNDPAFTLYGFVGEDQTFINDGSWIGSLTTTGIANGWSLTNNTFYLYPVTADLTDIDINGDGFLNWHEDIDGDGCIDSGNPIGITMLNEIIASVNDNCDGPTISIVGGYPEFFPGNYTITNNGSGTISGTPVTHGETITIEGLNDGDSWDIDISDGNGCSINVTGTYNFTQPTVTIRNLETDFCVGDPVDNFDATFSQADVCYSETQYIAGSDIAQTFTVSFPGASANVTSGTVTVTTHGDLGLTSEFWTIDNESGGSTDIGNSAGTDCSGSFTGSTALSAANLTTWSADNQIDFDLTGSAAVNPYLCGTDYVEVTLEVCESPTIVLSGFNVTDNGSGNGDFSPVTVAASNVTATASAGGCDFTDVVSVTVHEVPALGSTIDPEVCAGETILLSDYTPGEANGVAGTGTWYTDAGFTTAASMGAITPTNGDQFYYQYVSTAGSCTDDASITVTVNALPTATAANNGPLCEGEQLDLTGGDNGMTSYSWSGPSAYSNATQSPTVSAAATTAMAGLYTLTIDDGTCTNTATTTVTVNQVPVLSATTNPEVCADANNINLSTYTPSVTNGVAGSGQWYTGISNAGTPVSSTQTGLSDGDQFFYEFTSTAGSCTDDATITVMVNPVPVLSAVTNPEVCADANTIDLSTLTPTETAGVAGSGQWYIGTSNAGTPTSGSQTVSNGDQFYYEYTSTVGSCTDDVTITVTVNPLPVLGSVTDPAVCADANSIDLSTLTPTETAGVAGSGQWYTGISNAGTPVSGTQTGLSDGDQFYYEYTSTAGSCTDGHLLTVTVNPLPVLSAVTDPEVCAVANTIDLTALTPSETAGVVGSGQWYAGTSNTDPSVSGVQTVADGDQFYYEYTSTTGSCTADLTITVTVNSLPTANDQSAPGACEDVTGGGTIAGIDLTSYESSINGGAGVTYSWYSDAGLTTSVGTPSSVTVADGDIYYVEVTDGTTSCSDVAQVDFTVYSIPTVANLTPSICEDVLGSGQTAGVDLTGNNTSINSDAGVTYSWYTDAGLTTPVGTPASTTVNNGDIFYVEVDNGNCSDVSMVTYSVTSTIALTDPNPQLCEDVLAGGTYAGYDLTSINGSVYAGGAGTTYTWYQSDMTTLVGTPTNITLSNGDQYYVDVADGNCSNAIMVNFNVNALPTVTAVADIELCDEGGNMATFDLTTVESGVNATGPTYNWFSDAGLTTPIGTPATYSSGSGAVYVQVENSDGCVNDIDVNLLVNPLPTATTTTIEECDQGSNQATFDLTTVESTVEGGNGYTVNWFSDAVLATPIGTPVTYQTVSTTVYAEVIDGNTCSNSVGVTLTVNPLPTATDQNPAGICEDSPGAGTATVDLTAYEAGINGGAGVSINWFSDATLSTAVATPTTEAAANGAVYYAQVIDNTTLCEDTAEVTITIFSAPSATDLTPSICEDVLGSGQTAGVDLTGNNSSVNSGAGLTFNWYTDASLTSSVGTPTNVTVNNGDVFYVEATNGNCSEVAQITYTVTSTITLNDPAPEMCESSLGSLQFTGYDLTSLNSSVYAGSGSTVYTWYESDMITVVAGANNIIVNNGDQYYLEVVDGNCSNTIMITLTVNPLPTATDQTPAGICEDTPGAGIATVDLTSYEASIHGGAGVTVNWFSDANLSTSVATPTAESVSDGSVYYAQVIDNTTLCEDTAEVTFTVFTAPSATDITPSTCEDVLGSAQASGIDLTANNSNINTDGTLTFTWYTDAGLSALATNPTSATINDGDIFYVEVSNGNCTETAQVTYSVTSTITLTDPLPEMCESTAGSLLSTGYDLTSLDASVYTGSGSTTYTWYESDMTTLVGTPTSTDISNGGQYYIEVSDGNCSNGLLITFTVNPIPTMTPIAALELCDDGTGQATFDLTVQEANINGTGPTYTWYSDAGLTTTIGAPAAHTSATGAVYLEVTDANNCSNNINVDLTVNPLPAANTTTLDVCDDGTGQASFDLTSLESTVDGGAGHSISWFTDAGLTTPVATPAGFTSVTTTVYAEVTNPATGCTNSTTVDLNVTAAPAAPVISNDTTYCEGDAIGDLSATGSGGTITWYSDAALTTVIGTGNTFTPSISGTGSTTFYLNEDIGGCTSEADSVIVSVNSNPVASFTTDVTTGSVPLDVNYTDASTGSNLTYEWDFGDNNTSSLENPTNTFDNLGTFSTTLTVTDDNGCMDTTSTLITVAGEYHLIIPNVFSPNGDGVNDIFNLDGSNILEITGTIMNRWGQVMFQFDLLEMGWDGRTTAGLEASEGAYYYIIDVTDSSGNVYNYQGPFQLVR